MRRYLVEMTTPGTLGPALNFLCTADNWWHARAQAEKAHPNAVIAAVFYLRPIADYGRKPYTKET